MWVTFFFLKWNSSSVQFHLHTTSRFLKRYIYVGSWTYPQSNLDIFKKYCNSQAMIWGKSAPIFQRLSFLNVANVECDFLVAHKFIVLIYSMNTIWNTRNVLLIFSFSQTIGFTDLQIWFVHDIRLGFCV